MSANATKDDRFVECQLDCLVDILFGTDADRTTGAGDQFDVSRQRSAQPGLGDGALMAAADVHDTHPLRQGQGADLFEPLFGSDGHADVRIADCRALHPPVGVMNQLWECSFAPCSWISWCQGLAQYHPFQLFVSLAVEPVEPLVESGAALGREGDDGDLGGQVAGSRFRHASGLKSSR